MTHESRLVPSLGSFALRHIGPRPEEIQEMAQVVGVPSLEALVGATVPGGIRVRRPLEVGLGKSEFEQLEELRRIAAQNRVYRSFIGMGYYDCITPPVILRNLIENPRWYTQYTPYQAEISQGRLESLLNFQTMIMDLTAMEIANASMLDEGTAAAEAMTLCMTAKGSETNRSFFVSELCHPQTIEVVKTRATPLGIELIVGDHCKFDFSTPVFGVLLQYPSTYGTIIDYREFIERAHANGALAVVAADLLSLTLIKPPGEFGADIVVGNTQRFGVPMGFGGPHAAFFATRDIYRRLIPGRLVGLSKDVDGNAAVRLALQTREQHIRRDKATSNICTSQVLLANVATMYAVFHGPHGVREIADRIRRLTTVLRIGLDRLGFSTGSDPVFDTVRIPLRRVDLDSILLAAERWKLNLRVINRETVGVSIDETTRETDLSDLFSVFAEASGRPLDFSVKDVAARAESAVPLEFRRKSKFLTHEVFNCYHSETEMLRYLNRLQERDLSLAHSMIPLGSCTMKLNSTSEMMPVTWPEFSRIHPFAPASQTKGYGVMIEQLEEMLAEITGFDAVSLQPNAGSQGEYAGLLVIQRFHQSRGQGHRRVCLIPQSAHGTNPASAAMAGMRVVVVKCDSNGNVDLVDLRDKAREYEGDLAALMVTYPSTHGVFEEGIKEICAIVHECGGQVYMDGANMNAQIGLCRPGEFGPDVCHLNLHKTFCIPHGGGGPGMGPIAVKSHLAPFLPGHPVVTTGGVKGIGPVSSAPWGSPSILPISWMYISMMGSEGLTLATQVAILNANYVAKRLEAHFPVLYRGKEGMVAHECIFDVRRFKETAGVEVEDIAKRLMDYGFHAPTISFPVAGTLMVEPTESESKQELDRFCEAMIAIREEIAEIESSQADRSNNVLKNAPHTVEQICRSEWKFPYSREKAAFPRPWIRERKFWPPVGRIDNVFGDRNFICACPQVDTDQ